MVGLGKASESIRSGDMLAVDGASGLVLVNPFGITVGAAAVVGIQFLFVGSAYPWFACSAHTDITGALLVGLFPLMLAYLIVAALVSLMAASPES